MQTLTIFEQIMGLLGIAGVITGTAVWFLRNNTKMIMDANKEFKDAVNDALSSNQQLLSNDINSIRSEFSELRNHVDAGFTSVYDHIDKRNKESQDANYRHIQEVKGKITNMEVQTTSLVERIHTNEKALVEFRLDAEKRFVLKSTAQ